MSRTLRCEFIDAEKTTYGVRRLCRVRAVSKTADYGWVARDGGPTSHEIDQAHAIQELRAAWAEHRGDYEARRSPLKRPTEGMRGLKRVARLMSVGGFEGVHRRRKGNDPNDRYRGVRLTGVTSVLTKPHTMALQRSGGRPGVTPLDGT